MSALEIVMGEIVSRNLQTTLTPRDKANYLSCFKRDCVEYGKRAAMRMLIADLDEVTNDIPAETV